MRKLLPVLAWVFAACGFDGNVPHDVVLTCSAESPTCPRDHVCRPNVGRCFRSGEVDGEAPRLEATRSSKNRLKRGDRATLELTVSEPLFKSPVVTLLQEGRSVRLEVATVDPTHFSCTVSAGPDEKEGLAQVSVDLLDTVGNAANGLLAGTFTFDFTPPGLIASSVRLDHFATAAALGVTPRAIGPNSKAQVSFAFDDRLLEAPTLRSEPVGLDCVRTANTLSGATFECSPGGSSTHGPVRFVVTAHDDVGNETVADLGVQSSVDLLAPGAAATLDAGIWYARVRWGDSDGGPRFRVTGAAQASEPNATVLAFDPFDVEIGRAFSDDAGAFSLSLTPADRPVVRLAVVDSAGNPSPWAEVKNIEWVASLKDKVVGLTLPNPNQLERRDVFTTGNAQLDFLESTEPQRLGGVASWRQFGAPTTGLGPAVYDERRNKLVFFSINDAKTWEHDGTRWLNRSPGVSPPTTSSGILPSMAYDSKRGRVVYVTFDLQWEWDGVQWTQRKLASRPPPRFNSQIAYDSERGVTVLFSGRTSGFTLVQDTWEYDGRDWTQRAVGANQPGFRELAAMAYDPIRKRTVLFGGRTGAGDTEYSDTWEWDGSQWSLRTPLTTTPVRRRNHAMAFHPTRKTVLMSGGGGYALSGFYTDEIWEWNGLDWAKVVYPSLAPPAFALHSLMFRSADSKLVQFGGLSTQMWEHDGAAWKDVTQTWVSPGMRASHAMAYDSKAAQSLLFGGIGDGGYKNDLWEWNGLKWTERATVAQPPPRDGPAMVYDVANDELLMQGGVSFERYSDGGYLLQYFSDSWSHSDGGWRQRINATNPGPLTAASMAYDSNRSRAVLHGGYTGSFKSSSTWTWDGGAWQLRTSGAPGERLGAGMCFDAARDRVMLHGAGLNVDNDGTWEWNGSTWKRVADDKAGPGIRLYGSMVFDSLRSQTVLTGGGDGTWEWNDAGWADRTQKLIRPSSRIQQAMAFHAATGKTVLHGGQAGPPMSDTWDYGFDPERRPGVVVRFNFAEALAEPSSRLLSVKLEGLAGADAFRDGGSVGGAALWSIDDADTFLPRAANDAGTLALTALGWETTDSLEMSRLPLGPQQQMSFAVTPAGNNSDAVPASLRLEQSRLTVRYRRP